MNIYYLSDNWPWLGEHSSYNLLPKYVQRVNSNAKIIEIKYEFFERCIGKAYSISHGWWWRRDSIFAAAELRFLPFLLNLKQKSSLCHVLYFDNHHYLWERWKKSPENIIGTIHWPPPRRIPSRMLKNIKRLSSAIVLSKCDLEFYESLIGQNRVKFIRHGVDTEFFRPTKDKEFESKHIMFTGQNGRNAPMLYRIITELAKRHPQLHFDLLVRREIRNIGGLRQLLNYPNVSWYEDLTDEKLLHLYQKSYLLLLPMDDMSANNAIVEALACGLPVVTTDVGGIRDYGGGSVYPVVSNNDDGAMVDIVEQYLADSTWRDEVASKCREFAEQNLAWPIIVESHLKAYKELMK